MKMLTKSEYEDVIRVFLVELNYICLHASEQELRALPRLATEIDGILADLRDISNNSGNALTYAFGYIDEFVNADWESVTSTTYGVTRSRNQSNLSSLNKILLSTR